MVDRLIEFERAHVPTTFKFGVLYCRAKQSTEEEMYCNKEPVSASFTNFLALLGQKINLKGWDSFCGGLDTTGKGITLSMLRLLVFTFH